MTVKVLAPGVYFQEKDLSQYLISWPLSKADQIAQKYAKRKKLPARERKNMKRALEREHPAFLMPPQETIISCSTWEEWQAAFNTTEETE